MATFEKNGFIVLSNDSIFRWNSGKWTNTKLINKNLSLDDLLALNFNEKIYLVSRGVGLVYKLEGDSLSREDRSFNWRSRYNTLFFNKDEKIYSLGGYGLWTSKNNLIFFDKTTSEWTLEEYENAGEIPLDLSNGTIEVKDSLLFYIDVPVKGYNNNKNVHRYNFNSKNWISIGKRNSEIKTFTSNIRTNLDYPIVFDKDGDVGKFILSLNEFRLYKNPNIAILKDLRSVIGNPNTKDFLVFIENGTNKEIPIIVSETLLLGSDYETHKIYFPHFSTLGLLISIVIILFIFILVYALFKKRNSLLIDKIKAHWKEIETVLSKEELKILNIIIEKHPDKVELSYILDRFSPQLTYESKIKKFRKSINIIEVKLNRITKHNKGEIILSKRNKNDKRIKELFLNN